MGQKQHSQRQHERSIRQDERQCKIVHDGNSRTVHHLGVQGHFDEGDEYPMISPRNVPELPMVYLYGSAISALHFFLFSTVLDPEVVQPTSPQSGLLRVAKT